MEEMSFKTFLVNGGAMTISSSIFMILLINIRYRLTIKNIKSEHKLQNANNEIKSSIEYAEKIQKTILPSEKILKKYFENIFVFYLPRDIVSGDFYWLYNKNNKTYIAVVDCTGHGVPGAFLSFIGNDILIDAMKMDSTSSSSILLYLHKEIHERLNKYEKEENIKDSMDISLCIFNHEENTICFSGINNPLLLIRGNESTLIKGEGINLGDPSTNESQFRSHTIPILKGDIIYLYSDGFQDQFGGPKGRKVMSKTFRELIIKNSSLEMTEQKNKLQSYLKEWKKDEEQVDDITIIGIKY
jgi:serine phosphatase RsbU (regulator of sigma subunit)